MNEKHLTVADLANRLGVSEKTVYAWNSQGTGPPPLKLSRKCVRYRLTDVEAWERARMNGEAA